MKRIINTVLVLCVAVGMLSCSGQTKQQSEDICHYNTATEETQVLHPEWAKDASIYEVNVRQYTPEGTFEAFANHLPRLQQLGVKILWFMPIHPISEIERKGTLGSYYSVADYKAVNPEFGTFDDFKALVEKAHSMGFKVILDWVANHTGWDNHWIYNNPEWYTHDEDGNIIAPIDDWSDVADLNFDIPEMQASMIDALKFWVAEANIDGYRCDVAGMVPTGFWNDARAALDSIKPVYMLAEDEGETALLEKAFNSNYGWSFHHLMNSIANGEADVSELREYFEKIDSSYPAGSYPMQFTCNHDENSWNGTVYSRLGNAVETMAALSFVVPGMPLIYSGQEASLNKSLEFFEKDEIDWENPEMQQFYQKLIQLKKDNKALWNGCAGANIEFIDMETDNNLIAFKRQLKNNTVLCIFNFSEHKNENTFRSKPFAGQYKNAINEENYQINENYIFSLNAWEYLILVK